FVRLTSYTSAGSRDLCPCPTRRSSDLCADRALRGGAREGMVERTGGAPGVAAEPPHRRRQPSEAQRQQPETLDRARAPIIPLELVVAHAGAKVAEELPQHPGARRRRARRPGREPTLDAAEPVA